MQQLKILNKKETKRVLEILDKQWGFKDELDYVFLFSSKSKIYLINKDMSKVDVDKMRIDTLGMYFGEMKSGEIRLSIEGSQIIGKKAKKSVAKIHYNIARLWMRGYDIEYDGKEEGFVLVKTGNDFLGCGKIKEGKILNHVPISRRIKSED